ncbi:MAG: hypothetical protein JXR96_27085 [Deltaproteobacteria bacterium]|nr:hypothetical protein [Deltaproteobacteria bacterium]
MSLRHLHVFTGCAAILAFTNGFCCNLLETLDPDYVPSPLGEMIREDLARD